MEDNANINETVENSVSQEEPSINDTLREALRSMGSTEPVEQENTTVEEVTTQPLKEQIVDTQSNAEKSVEETAQTIESLPNSWKKEAADAWIKADPLLRAEVQRREADFHKGIEQYRQAADFARSVGEVIIPYQKTIESLGFTPQQAIKALLDADHKLRYSSPEDKSLHVMQLAKSYGIDLNNVVSMSQNADPRLYELKQQNEMLQQQFHQHQQQVQQQTDYELNSHISAFAADPKHPHFEAVKLDMAALLQAGRANSLEDAYEKAIYANSDVRNAVLKQQAKTSKEEAAKKAQAAKVAASVNMRSTPAMPTKETAGSMQDTIREVYRRATNQV